MLCDDKGIYSYIAGADSPILELTFLEFKIMAEEGNNIKFKYIVDFCEKTQFLSWNLGAFDYEIFARYFESIINIGLENDYDLKVASKLRERLGEKNYFSLWKKEIRRSKSVNILNRKPKSSENVKKFHEI